MTGNIAIQAARLLIAAFIVIAIALAVIGRDPSIAARAFVPFFVLLVFAGVGLGLWTAARS